MLDRAKLLKSMEPYITELFVDLSREVADLQESWQRIIHDPLFIHKVRQVSAPWPIPLWYESLQNIYAISSALSTQYTVVAVDGSQIYPDKHQGTSCFLVNIGTVEFSYGDRQGFRFLGEPYFFPSGNHEGELAFTDQVDGLRQELELQAGYSWCSGLQQTTGIKPLLLFDGSLVFWHLDAKEQDTKKTFLNRYVGVLQKLYEAGIITASYISMPKSKDLINLVRLELCNFQPEQTEMYKVVEQFVDTHIAYSYLTPYSRSILFKSSVAITRDYPEHLQPHFFYIHVGQEIARVEVPAWVAQQESMINQIASILVDQVQKGYGYPVALAEAHEQAVVKGPDREFFYHLLQKMSIEQKRRLVVSPKSLKKRGIGV